ncbi:MAG: isoprenylcysteine carboxylmethyltransferase family protein [Candidatus Paceibacterota bacterium]|jgi:protein-S-isoprenylcysteine O-methyltransferase Ste14
MISRFVNPFILWTFIVLGGAAIFFGFDANVVLLRTSLSCGVFMLTLMYWLLLVIRAVRGNVNVVRSVAGVKSLVKTGIYTRVRHPIYSADIVLVWGIFFITSSFPMFLTALWVTLVMILWARLEEEYLMKRFKAAYVGYCAQTPMLIPRVCGVKKVRAPKKRKPKAKVKKVSESLADEIPQI